MLKDARQKLWYVLMTMAGEQAPDARGDRYDVCLHARNRRYFNGWMAQALSDEDKRKLIDAKRATEEDLAPLKEDEKTAIRKVFAGSYPEADTIQPDTHPCDLADCEITGVICHGFVFSGDAIFRSSSSEHVCFRDATFFKKTDFHDARFRNTDFRNASFEDDAAFQNATFSGDATFQNARFRNADFQNASFKDDAAFQNASSSGDVCFRDATFFKKTDFHDAKFRNADFGNATFYGDAAFQRATFSGDAAFQNASFFEKTLFQDVKFQNADFRKASFEIHDASSGDATFQNATSSGDATFQNATFSGNALFQNASFSRGTTFQNAKFQKTDFEHAAFSGDAAFRSTSFSGDASFQNAAFSGSASFQNATFSGDANFSDATFKGPTTLVQTGFENWPPKFFNAALHEDTDFTDVGWPAVPKNPKDATNHRRRYERLKQLMDSQKKFFDEHRFHRLELRCREVEDGWRSFSGVGSRLFRYVSDYGWSIGRPLCGLTITFLCGGWGLIRFDPELELGRALGLSFSNTFSLLGLGRTFFQEELTGLTPTSEIVSGVQFFLGPLFLFLLGLALRNRFRIR